MSASHMIDIDYDPWEPERNRRAGAHKLTSVEITVTNRCNMRCVHCAVGEVLSAADPDRLPLSLLIRRLDEAEHLTTLSITGGEPSGDRQTVAEVVLPILQYARRRGLRTQINTNLTYDLARYEAIAEVCDVLHITWNYADAAQFHRTAWGHTSSAVKFDASERLFERILANAQALSASGHFLSAESMVNGETAAHLGAFNRQLAALGVRRHEVHPMYPVDWASGLPTLSKEDFRMAIERFLTERDADLWVLFGTFPFLPCSPVQEDRDLWRKAREERNVTIRNCPDGRNRVNINLFTGEVFVTDFADVPALGNLQTDALEQVFARWQSHPVFAPYNCYCPEAACTGPNLIVAQMYHPGVDFRERKALL